MRKISALFLTDRQTLWPIEVVYAIKSDLLGFININTSRANIFDNKRNGQYSLITLLLQRGCKGGEEGYKGGGKERSQL